MDSKLQLQAFNLHINIFGNHSKRNAIFVSLYASVIITLTKSNK